MNGRPALSPRARRAGTATALAATAFLALGGASMASAASTPMRPPVIVACVKPGSDFFRWLPSTSVQCARGEDRLEWKSTPVGATGPTGETGARGAAGQPGLPGDNGVAGVAGQNGLPGLPGADSETSAYDVAVTGGFVGTQTEWLASLVGEQGPQGPAGVNGLPGADGMVGATGLPGEPGEPGPFGVDGPQGPQGEPGPMGPQGPQGPDGAAGATGTTGADGLDGMGIAATPGEWNFCLASTGDRTGTRLMDTSGHVAYVCEGNVT